MNFPDTPGFRSASLGARRLATSVTPPGQPGADRSQDRFTRRLRRRRYKEI